jgi:iron(III) transport system substrate-binding protein
LSLFPQPARAADKGEVWAYTSVYKEYLKALEDGFAAKHPGLRIQSFQAGSEKIKGKVEAELLAQRPLVNVLMVSDPFWPIELAQRGLLWQRPGHPLIETNYTSLMVLVVHRSLPADQRPTGWADLARPALKDQVQMGSPLESGTTFTTVAYLSRRFGWDYFKKLRANGLVSAGGNSTVIQKVESGERKVGVVLLENALAAQKRGTTLEILYPAEGGIPIPSVQAVLASSPDKEAAGKFADFVLGDEGQRILRSGYMYPASASLPPPEGARPYAEATKGATPWTEASMAEVARDAKELKKKFAALVLE